MPTSQGSEDLIWPDSGSLWLSQSRPVDPSWIAGDVRFFFGRWHTEYVKRAPPSQEIVACIGDRTQVVWQK